ncbi:galactokinase [Flavobacteriaceae bacterium MAR_2010_105]|nr:galactokinase [Flavobacteriaceae bacterium MAR_2010_105]
MDQHLEENNGILSIAPGRICLFGDHQDYLGLPIIACAINRHITLKAVKNNNSFFYIKMPDVNEERIIKITDQLEDIGNDDHLRSALKVLRRYNCVPVEGYDITIVGNLPINAGTSSSTAMLIAWLQFIIQASGSTTLLNPETIAQIAYEAEVLEHGNPGGKMDQYSIALGKVLYLETGNAYNYQSLDIPLKGLIIGESGIPKKTVGLLKELKEKTWLAIHRVMDESNDFDLSKTTSLQIKKYLHYIPESLKDYFIAAISNHEITKKAFIEFKKDQMDYEYLGTLMNAHHEVLKNLLKITVPRIDDMIAAALNSGAYGAKIVGSGGGGNIIALAPEGKEKQVIQAIKNAGAKDAYQVKVDNGPQIINLEKVLN